MGLFRHDFLGLDESLAVKTLYGLGTPLSAVVFRFIVPSNKNRGFEQEVINSGNAPIHFTIERGAKDG